MISWLDIAARRNINMDACGFRKHSLDEFIMPTGNDQLKPLQVINVNPTIERA